MVVDRFLFPCSTLLLLNPRYQSEASAGPVLPVFAFGGSKSSLAFLVCSDVDGVGIFVFLGFFLLAF